MTDPRVLFGTLVRNARSMKGWQREELASRVGVRVEVIQNLEHGVPNPTRQECCRVIKVLKLGSKRTNEAYSLLNSFSPRRYRRFKLHSNFFIRSRQIERRRRS